MTKSTRLRAIFKRRLDLTDLDKYLTYGFDGQRISGINNTNLIILML